MSLMQKLGESRLAKILAAVIEALCYLPSIFR
jgi:hypothetical protein